MYVTAPNTCNRLTSRLSICIFKTLTVGCILFNPRNFFSKSFLNVFGSPYKGSKQLNSTLVSLLTYILKAAISNKISFDIKQHKIRLALL